MNPAVCLNVTFRKMGLSRKVDVTDLDPEASRRMLAASKKLLDCLELEDITSLDGQVRSYLERRCLPSMFKKGIYLLPMPLVKDVMGRLVEYEKKRAELVDIFTQAYPSRVEQAKGLLGKHFSERDYPSPSSISRFFAFTYRLMDVVAPEGLKGVDMAAFEKAEADAKQSWKEALDEARAVLRCMLKELVDHMVERLGSDSTKPKIFRDTLITNMEDFLTTFSARNIAKDSDLQALVEQARKVMGGVTPDMLRENEAVRDYVKENLTKVKATLDTMVTERPSRAFSFDE